jgi:pyruvate/2-oxoglutarate dehydrogenase complex dihydrolipoamide acyltransferase (E2) component
MFLSATCALAAVLLSAPPATETAPPAAAPAPAAKPSPRAPAAPDAALAPLGFLEGHWVTTLPNGMVSEESWLPVRGKSMLGSFRQTRPDGNPAFFEFTQVVASDKGVVLRQVHVHSRFETDERRKEPMFLKLAKAEDDAATFVPVGDGEFGEGTSSHAGDLASVTYARTKAEDGSDRLTLRIESRPVKDPKKPDAEPQPQVIEITMKRAS